MRLQAVQEVNRLGSVRSGGEDRPLVVLEHLQPGLDIAGVVVANFGRDLQVGTKESRSQFGDQFFHCVAFIAPAFAAEFPVEAGFVPRPVRQLVGERGGVRFGTPVDL